MSEQRWLIIAGTLPGNSSVGELYLSDFRDALPAGILCWFSWGNQAGPALDDPVCRVASPYSAVEHRTTAGRAALFARDLYWRWHDLAPAVSRAVAFAKQQQVTGICAVLDRPFVARLAVQAARALRVPLCTLVWDPPAGIATNFGLDRLTAARAGRDFEEALASSLRCGVMCEAMAETYAARYGVATVIVRHGIDPAWAVVPRTSVARRDRLVIGLAGSIYARREWRAFLAALATSAWRLDGREIVLRTLVPELRLPALGPVHVEHYGWRPMREAVALLAGCNLTYLPYYRDPQRREHMRLAFPTKLTAYLAARRPVLFHGPADASVARFFRDYPAGVCCDSDEPEVLLACLRRLVGEPARYAAYVREAARAFECELSEPVFRARVAELLGLQPSARPKVVPRAAASRRPEPAYAAAAADEM